MDATYPAEDWDQFLLAGQPNWNRITVAGHSQGAGHAGYMAKLYVMDRIVMISGPPDTGTGGSATASWLSLPNVTPPSRQYGFTHTDDGLVPVARAEENWQAAGLGAFGALTSVDGAVPPYGNSHQLTTSVPTAAVGGIPPDEIAHLSPVYDAVMPSDTSGDPLYRPVWVYMAFP